MKNVFQKILIALLAILWGVSSVQAQNVQMDRYITLTVEKGADILLDIAAAAANTPIKIVSGDKEQTITVGTDWTDQQSYVAGATIMTVYGNVSQFDCSANASKITAMDVTHNTQLQGLFCYKDSIASLNIGECKYLKELRCDNNLLSSLDLNQCIALEKLRCSNNRLTSLDVSRCTALKELYCYENLLTSINISGNNQLTWLSCYGNSLTSLDISNNTMLERLYCFENSLTSLDVSHNTHLSHLCCYANGFTTVTLDDIYCSLPDRKGQNAGIVQPVLNASSTEKDKIIATNGNNAANRNWKVQYYETDTDVKGFTGTKQCANSVNMDSYITLTVDKGKDVSLSIYASADNTPIKIVSGSKEYNLNAGIGWTQKGSYTAETGTMTIYGNVVKLNCDKNGKKITGLDASHNIELMNLFCSDNAITLLDVSKNTQLEYLHCEKNQVSTIDLKNCPYLKILICGTNSISSLDVSKNSELEWLLCDGNSISSLNVSKNTKLIILNCQSNKITSLNVSKNPKLFSLQCYDNSISSLNINENTVLEELYCEKNKIETLDISRNTVLKTFDCSNNLITAIDASKNPKLTELTCYGNLLTTTALDDIYCSLPIVTGTTEDGDEIGIYPLYNSDDTNSATILASNGKNATDRNWKIAYYESADDITGFTGTHSCTNGVDDIKNTNDISVFPNPVRDVINIASDKPVHSIRIYNVYGTEVLYAADTDSVDISPLPAGVYMVRADGKVTRVIKE